MLQASPVTIRPYLSPTLVLLAFDWQEGRGRSDFLGFAIERTPGFGKPKSWLPNRISFEGPAPEGGDLPSNENPIQKFMWWDSRINSADRGNTFRYSVTPVVGKPGSLELLTDAASAVDVAIPQLVEQGIGTYFNRAVVSSQAFMKEFGANPSKEKVNDALAWLGNGMEKVIPDFLNASPQISGAIYHLTDDKWVLPALSAFQGPASLVVNRTTKDTINDKTVEALEDQKNLSFSDRTKASIMHDKFLVRYVNGLPAALLMGSANFTTGGLTSQANVLHTWESPELAALYDARHGFLKEDPSMPKTRAEAGWSKRFSAGDASLRVFFPPEKKPRRESIDTVVAAVQSAKQSVVFCLFSTTDEDLRNACFGAGDQGKMMFGLVNTIGEPKADGKKTASSEAAMEIYHRSQANKDVVGHSSFRKDMQPAGFWWEISSMQKAVSKETGGNKKGVPEVYVHHKFVVIDGETANPIIYTGSANFSGNSLWNNDENLLEIKDSPRMAQIYLAEFLRLYEHYRARAAWNRRKAGDSRTYSLEADTGWAAQAYQPGTPEFRSRVNLAGHLS